MNNEFDNQSHENRYDWQQPENHSKWAWSIRKIIVLALACALVGGAVGATGTAVAIGAFRQTESESKPQANMLVGDRENVVLNTVKIETGKLMSPAEVYAANVNSTVGITTSVTTNYWGYQTTSAAAGSGFILTEDGYIITNYHVVKSSDSITVSLYDGTGYEAELIGYDESNDIAVLKVESDGLTPVILGDSDNINVGDSVVAIGNPLGELTFSLTAGAVSAMDREVTMSNGVTMNLIQTDCAINSGNSGGALFNLYGEVIGVTNAKYSGNSGGGATIDNIGFAIPMNRIRVIVESIIEKGYIAKPYIGISVIDVSEETQKYGLPKGAAVYTVVEGSPAEAAGLQENDIITKANETEIKGRRELAEIISSMTAGDVLDLQIYRKGENLNIAVTVGEQIQSALEEKSTQPNNSFGGYKS